jgi:hypothetical protein
MIKLATAQVWVHDRDEGLAFCTRKLGWQVRSDLTMRGGVRNLVTGDLEATDPCLNS